MHPDKKLMLAGLVLWIAFIALLMNVNLIEEKAVFDQAEKAFKIVESMAHIYATPLNNYERINIIQDNVDKLIAYQDRNSKTIVMKRFFDYKDVIEPFQDLLAELRQNDDPENQLKLTFLTNNEHTIVSDAEFTKESLLKLAGFIDNTFPVGEELLFVLNCEYGYVSLIIVPDGNPENLGKVDLEEFATMLSYEVFNGDPVLIDIDYRDAEPEAKAA